MKRKNKKRIYKTLILMFVIMLSIITIPKTKASVGTDIADTLFTSTNKTFQKLSESLLKGAEKLFIKYEIDDEVKPLSLGLNLRNRVIIVKSIEEAEEYQVLMGNGNPLIEINTNEYIFYDDRSDTCDALGYCFNDEEYIIYKYSLHEISIDKIEIPNDKDYIITLLGEYGEENCSYDTFIDGYSEYVKTLTPLAIIILSFVGLSIGFMIISLVMKKVKLD